MAAPDPATTSAAASATGSMIPVIAAGVSAIPVLLAPIIAWTLGRSRVSSESAAIDRLNKRLDLIERIDRLQAQFPNGPMKELMETELQHCRTFLAQPPASAAVPSERVIPASSQSRFDRFFLVGQAGSARQRIFKGLFYFFFGVAVVVLVSPLAFVAEPEFPKLLPTMLFAATFYFILSFICRRFAR